VGFIVFRILLAEDNPGDVLLFQEAIKGRNLPCEIVVAEDGHKAIAILKAAHSDGTRLDLIVLDVNLPKHNGDAVLREVRGRDSLADIPVIMLTSSASPTDKAAATKFGANLYIQKSSDLGELLEVGKLVEGILRRDQDARRQPD
jgi:CheY-like chemotaxis protein